MRFIYIDSRDRVPGGTATDFRIQLPQTLSLEGGAHSGRIDNLRLPIAVPTIQTGVNDTFIVQIGSTKYTITLPQGQVDGPTLASSLQSLLAANCPGTWQALYDTSNIALYLQSSSNFTVVGGTFGNQLLSRPYTRPSSSRYNFLYVPVTGIDQVYLCCPEFSNLDIVGPNGAHDTLCSVIVTEPFGSVQDYSMTQGLFFDVPNLCTQQLSFQLRDRNYNLLSSIANFSFVLAIE